MIDTTIGTKTLLKRIRNVLVLHKGHDCSDELDVYCPDGCAASTRETKKEP